MIIIIGIITTRLPTSKASASDPTPAATAAGSAAGRESSEAVYVAKTQEAIAAAAGRESSEARGQGGAAGGGAGGGEPGPHRAPAGRRRPPLRAGATRTHTHNTHTYTRTHAHTHTRTHARTRARTHARTQATPSRHARSESLSAPFPGPYPSQYPSPYPGRLHRRHSLPAGHQTRPSPHTDSDIRLGYPTRISDSDTDSDTSEHPSQQAGPCRRRCPDWPPRRVRYPSRNFTKISELVSVLLFESVSESISESISGWLGQWDAWRGTW